jgi:hypothetical protein
VGGGGVVTNQTGIILIDIKILVIQDGNLSDLCKFCDTLYVIWRVLHIFGRTFWKKK